MKNTPSMINYSVTSADESLIDTNDIDISGKMKVCQMRDDSMQPTIQLYEMVSFMDCDGNISSPGVYVFTDNIFGRNCLFIKRVIPKPGGELIIISDNDHYINFILNANEQTNMHVHGRVIASIRMGHFA